MTVKRFVLTMLLTTAICWSAVAMILWKVDPYTATGVGMALFYIACFFSLWGTISLLGIAARMAIHRTQAPFTYIGICLRQALWFAILACLTLFLLSQSLFDWWMGMPLVIGFASIEGFFLSKTDGKKRSRTRMHRARLESDDETDES